MNPLSHLIRSRGHTLWTRPLNAASVVVDAGAHRGEFSRNLHAKFGCRCILIEANPRLAAALSAPPGGQVIPAALSATDGLVSFNVDQNPEAGGIETKPADSGQEMLSIESLSLVTLKARLGLEQIDLLKLDIEGSEFELLQQTPDAVLSEIGQITVEFHDFLPAFGGRGLYEAARARLEKLGFLCCPMAFRTHGDVLFLNRRKIPLSFIDLAAIRGLGKWVLKLQGEQS